MYKILCAWNSVSSVLEIILSLSGLWALGLAYVIFRPIVDKNRQVLAGGMVQRIEQLPSKWKALSSNPSITKKK
jgi:hypothetical protein